MQLTSVNLWENWDSGLQYWEKKIANTSTEWFGTDIEANLEKNKPTYKKGEFDYKFNSVGFRSNEYDNTDSIKILYSGCSVTEGIGLPPEHIWSSFLNDKIATEVGKPVKLFSVARGGSSIDTIIRMVYISIESGFKPDCVKLLLPPPTRQEVLYIDSRYNMPSLYSFIPNYPPQVGSDARLVYNHLIHLTNYKQRYHDCIRNLLLLKWYLLSKNINWSFSFWDNSFSNLVMADVMPEFTDLDTTIPKDLKEHWLPGALVFDNFYEKYDKNPSHPGPFVKKFEHIIARDGTHYGPNSHYNFANHIYDQFVEKDYFQKLLTDWRIK